MVSDRTKAIQMEINRYIKLLLLWSNRVRFQKGASAGCIAHILDIRMQQEHQQQQR
jgi:hypothetical protein